MEKPDPASFAEMAGFELYPHQRRALDIIQEMHPERVKARVAALAAQDYGAIEARLMGRIATVLGPEEQAFALDTAWLKSKVDYDAAKARADVLAQGNRRMRRARAKR